MRTLNLYIFLALLLISNSVWAQVSLSNKNTFPVDASISKDDAQKVFTAVENTLTDYAEDAKIFDENEKRVNKQAVDRFLSHFSNIAKIQDDYNEYPTKLMEPEDYANTIFDFFLTKGLVMEVTSAKILEFRSDGNFYVCKVEVSKRFYNYLSSSGKVETSVSGLSRIQRMNFDVRKSDLESAKITNIDFGKDRVPAADWVNILNFSIHVGSSSYSPTYSSHWKRVHSNTTLDANGGVNFSLGGEFVTNRLINGASSTNKDIGISAGLRFASFETKTVLRSYSKPDHLAIASHQGVNEEYLRLVGPVAADEKIRYGVLEVPLGLAYTVKANNVSRFLVHLRVVPGIVMSGIGNIEGDGVWDGILIDQNSGELSEFRILRPTAVPDRENNLLNSTGFGPYDVGEKNFEHDADPMNSGFVMGLQFSPTAYMNFTNEDPGWGLSVGLDIGYQFNSFIEHDPIQDSSNDLFENSEDYRQSLLSTYATDNSGWHFGIRLGLFQRISSTP